MDHCTRDVRHVIFQVQYILHTYAELMRNAETVIFMPRAKAAKKLRKNRQHSHCHRSLSNSGAAIYQTPTESCYILSWILLQIVRHRIIPLVIEHILLRPEYVSPLSRLL